GKEGPQSFYGIMVYFWWHFLARKPAALDDFTQWHHHNFATPPPVVCKPISAEELATAIHNHILLYPADPPAYTSRESTPTPAPVVADTTNSSLSLEPTFLPFPLFSSTQDPHWMPGYVSPA
ncbi:unnamed protein product, partial [Rhizoctonia solani]